jgi:anti-sigma regulatory factor (Ser/Thr protein kinase)
MSAVCILAPIVIAGWPAFSAAVMAAATSLGYQVVSEAAQTQTQVKQADSVQLEIARSELITNQLGRAQKISVTKEGVTVTVSRDARGKASLCVTGQGQAEEALRAMGEELSRAVVQQYVYQRLMEEIRARGFVVAEEEQNADRSIRLKVRQWEA